MLKLLLFVFSVFYTIHVAAQKIQQAVPTPVISMDSLFKAKALESIGKPFPGFNSLFQNGIFTKDSIKGKVVFVNFWFEACPPCIAELDALNQLYKKFGTNKHFQFLSFTFEKPAAVQRLRKKFKMEYPVASVSRQECYRLNQNNGFPTSIIIDEAGVIRYLFTGGDANKKQATDFILQTVFADIKTELNN